MNILAIDQGTSATKALLVGPGAEVLERGEVPVGTRSVGADGVEADPEELFGFGPGRRAAWRWPRRALPAQRGRAGQPGRDGVWRGTRTRARPLSTALVWQDGRAASVCALELAEHAGRDRRSHRPRLSTPTSARRRWPGCGAPHPARRGHHHRHLAAGPARRGVRDRRRHRSRPCARPGLGGVVGRQRGFGLDPGDCRRWRTAPRSWARRPRSARWCPSRGSPSTSRLRCSPSAARPGRRNAPSAPARSSWSRGPAPYGPAPGFRLGGVALGGASRTAWTVRSTPRARRCRARRSAGSGRPPSPMRWAKRPGGDDVTFVPALAGLAAPTGRRARASSCPG